VLIFAVNLRVKSLPGSLIKKLESLAEAERMGLIVSISKDNPTTEADSLCKGVHD
jgi:hypothetical protein